MRLSLTRLLATLAAILPLLFVALPHMLPAPPSPAPVHGLPADSAYASLVLDRDTFALDITACDLSGEVDDTTATLHATQQAPGATLDVEVTRSRLRGSLIQRIRVALRDGDTERMAHVAEHVYGLGGWNALYGGPEAPLLSIHGDTLRATGRFAPAGPDAAYPDTLSGELYAICP